MKKKFNTKNATTLLEGAVCREKKKEKKKKERSNEIKIPYR